MKQRAVLEARDLDNLYELPLELEKQAVDQLILEQFEMEADPVDMTEWIQLVDRVNHLDKDLHIALVGKYTELPDAYLSVIEALKHAGYHHLAKIHIHWINAEKVTDENVDSLFKMIDGIVVPGGFGSRGTEGKLAAIQYARTHQIPFLGICLGMQLATIEYARNVCGLKTASSTEWEPETHDPIICLIDENGCADRIGGTLRLGNYPCQLKQGTLAEKLYQSDLIQERHRHRYEINKNYRALLEECGLIVSGMSTNDGLIEIIEIKDHPFFLATQFHPEFGSRPTRAHPIFIGLIDAMLKRKS